MILLCLSSPLAHHLRSHLPTLLIPRSLGTIQPFYQSLWGHLGKIFYQWCWHPALGFGNLAPILPIQEISIATMPQALVSPHQCNSANKSKCSLRAVRHSSASCATRCQQHWHSELLLQGKHKVWCEVKSWPTQWWSKVRGKRAELIKEEKEAPHQSGNWTSCQVGSAVWGREWMETQGMINVKCLDPSERQPAWKQHSCSWWYSAHSNKGCHCPGWYFKEKSLVVWGQRLRNFCPGEGNDVEEN